MKKPDLQKTGLQIICLPGSQSMACAKGCGGNFELGNSHEGQGVS